MNVNKLIRTTVGTALMLICLCSMAYASPAIDIRYQPNGPVTGGPHGPGFDPYSKQGQWFMDRDTERYDTRRYEFYDNQFEHGGSDWANTKAIHGLIVSVDAATGKFVMDISITNDTRFLALSPWEGGTNSHNESLTYDDASRYAYSGTMYDVKLTTEFAMPDFSQEHIYTREYDQLAWYCDSVTGNFIVPTFDFGDILLDQTVTRRLEFFFDPTNTNLAGFLSNAMDQGYDMLSNRTTSLKISQFLDSLNIDDGTPYLNDPLNSSNASVFFNPVPVPGAVWLLSSGLLGFAVLTRKKQA